MIAAMLMLVVALVNLLLGPVVAYCVMFKSVEVGWPIEAVSTLFVSRIVGGISGIMAAGAPSVIFAGLAWATVDWSNLSIVFGLLGSFPLDDNPGYPPWHAWLLFASTLAWLGLGLFVQGLVTGRLVMRWGYRGVMQSHQHEKLVRRAVYRTEWLTSALLLVAPIVYAVLAFLSS